MKNVVLLGPPASGKGTLANYLAEEHGAVNISTGEALRKAVKSEGSEFDNLRRTMDIGEMVDDETVMQILSYFLKDKNLDKGIIFDGVPRTVDQVGMLDSLMDNLLLKVDFAINLVVPKQDLIDRATARLSCSACPAIFNTMFFPPKVEGICDKCHGETLYVRSEDTTEVAVKRLKVYNEKTRPIIDVFKARGGLHVINSDNERGDDRARVCKAASELVM